jgi:hypothetical protein
MPTRSTIEHHTSTLLDGLYSEFGGEFEHMYIDAVGHSHLERLLHGARVLGYIPVVYCATKNDLVAIHHNTLHNAA